VSTHGGSQSVDRAGTLLARVVESDSPPSFTSLVDELGLAKSTASRLLHALERNRLVRRDRDGCFHPGSLFAAYAARRDAVRDLVDVATPALERLAKETGETVNLAVPSDGVATQVAQIDSRHLLGATNWVGVQVPTHCSAVGKVLLAYGTLPAPADLLRCTKASQVTQADLDSELVQVRRRGWALSWEELEPGLVAVAAPVRAHADAVVAAVSLAGPTARITRSDVPRLAGRVAAEAEALSALLGQAARVRDAPDGSRGEGAA
jgi:IclR family transcriptional regulator, acetate operon repressor